MCQEWVECTLFKKCGHLVVTKDNGYFDCHQRDCEMSYFHPVWCRRDDCVKEYQNTPRRPRFTEDAYCWDCEKRLTVRAADLPTGLPTYNKD